MNKNTITIIPEIIIEENDCYFIVLSPADENDKRDIHLEIGDAEATNIFLIMNSEYFPLKRPDTYDMFIDSLDKFDIKVTATLISDRTDNLWYGTLELFNTKTNQSIYMDVRPSDVIALSEKLKTPLLIYEDILTGFIENVNKKKSNKNNKKPKQSKNYAQEKMNNMLNTYIENEEYEKAAELKKIMKEQKK